MLCKLSRIFILCLLLLPAVVNAIVLQVAVKGADPKLVTAILTDLHLHQAISEPKLTDARVQNLYDIAEAQITDNLQAHGYYNSTIIHSLVKYPAADPNNDRWLAEFVITLGPATTINSVDVNVQGPGRNNPKIKQFLVTPKLKVGKIITHVDYEDTKQTILSDFNSIGYLKVDFSQSALEVDRDKHIANIKLVVNTGKQYVFGKVTFIDGLYPDSLLKRFIPFHSGQAYELKQLMQFQDNLEQGDLFNKIRFDPEANMQDPDDTTVPINVRLTAKPRNRYTGSIGYGTDTGIRASAGWLHRRTQTPGHRVFSYASYSKILHLGKINYIIPGEYPATDRYIVGGSISEEFVEQLYSRKGELYANKLFKRGKTETDYGINLFTETFHLDANLPNFTRYYLLPNAKWVWINNYEIDIFEYGTRFEARVRGGVKGVLSSTSVIQLDVGVKHIVPVITDTRFIIRSNIGAVASAQFATVPPSLRYFTGGDDTVRGFQYNIIGPRSIKGNPNSENLGGKYLFIVSGELERRIYEKFSGVVFFDAGNASMNFGGPLAMAPGFGIRYKTPLGNLRCDLAKPLNTVENKHWRLHLNFATDFQ